MRSVSSASASSGSVKSISLWELTGTKLPPPEPDYWAKKPSFWPKKPSLFARSLRLAKIGLLAFGIVSIGAVAGMANYFLNDVAGTPLFASADAVPAATEDSTLAVSEDAPLPAAEDTAIIASEDQALKNLAEASAEEPQPPEPANAAPPKDRLAALLDAPETSDSDVPPAILKQVSMLRAPPPQDVVQQPRADDAAQVALLSSDSRLPRSRPDEPIYTGSIGRTASGGQQVADRKSAKPSRWQRFGPCAALRGLRVAYLFGNRCGHYTHYDPQPPRQPNPAPREDARVMAASPAAPHPYQPPRVMQD